MKALVAMSGGVDSSVAAALTKEAGYDCIGVTMKLFYNDEVVVSREHSCCSLDDVEDARSVAQALEIPYYVFNFTDRFRENVLDKFVYSYEHGETPNPCIDCNRYLKFEKLFQRARELGCDKVVTGHYAKIEQDPYTGRFLLKKAADPSKDQSYVLSILKPEQLSHILFPLGGMSKTETRMLAEQYHFINAKKHDSQDICFVQEGNYADFIEKYTGKHYSEGPFVDREGHILGTHRGIIHYTIGQRKGLYLSFPKPHFVCEIRPETNEVVLGESEELFSSSLTARDLNLISVDHLDRPVRLKAKIRYRQAEQWATVTQTDESHITVLFDEPQRAITKGQTVALYDGDIVVGSGTIDTIGF